MDYFFRVKRDILINDIAGSRLMPISFRLRLFRLYGIFVGEQTTILSHVYVGGHNIRIGKRCFINNGCHFDSQGDINIEDDVWLGMDVLLCTSTHEIGTAEKRAGKSYGKSINIGAGSWIGARSTILPGVSIGAGSVIAAGAVVTKDVPPSELWGGGPARCIRKLES